VFANPLSSKYIVIYELVNIHLLYVCRGRFYVGCNVCEEWFHGLCVGVSANDIHKLSSYTCRSCSHKNSRTDSAELHCICQTPYDESK